jgi:DNA modification methylase
MYIYNMDNAENCTREVNFDDRVSAFMKEYSINKKPVDVSFRNMVNWLNRPDRATHLIHSYPAKLLMHIPYFFLNNSIFSRKGSTILDPFCGSGTVLLEALLAGRSAAGIDINPLARLISEVKIGDYDLPELHSWQEELKHSDRKLQPSQCSSIVDLDFWFLPGVKRQLASLLHSIDEINEIKYKKFFLVCFSNCVKKVSLADPRISVPVKLTEKKYPRNHPAGSKIKGRLKKLKSIDIGEFFFEIVSSNIQRVEMFNRMKRNGFQASIIGSDARKIKNGNPGDNDKMHQEKSIDLIITSPPYAGAQKYFRASRLNLGWLESAISDDIKSLEKRSIGREDYQTHEYRELVRTGIKNADLLLEEIYKINPLRAHIAATYLVEMKEALIEASRVLKTGGFLILVAANNQVCKKEFKTQEYLTRIIEELGLEVVFKLIDDIRSYGLMTKRNKTASIITREWVLVFQKRRQQ